MARTRFGMVMVWVAVLATAACTSSTDPGAAPDDDVMAASSSASGGATPGGSASTATATPPGATEIETALEALTSEHGEYAAYATYKAIIDEFGAVQPYTNILGSEQKHIDFLVGYLEGAGVEIPENPWLGQVGAPADLPAAAQTGIDTEIDNVAMYDALLERDLAPDLADLLERLRGMSQDRHLPAFEAALENGGVGTEGGMGHGGGNG